MSENIRRTSNKKKTGYKNISNIPKSNPSMGKYTKNKIQYGQKSTYDMISKFIGKHKHEEMIKPNDK